MASVNALMSLSAIAVPLVGLRGKATAQGRRLCNWGTVVPKRVPGQEPATVCLEPAPEMLGTWFPKLLLGTWFRKL